MRNAVARVSLLLAIVASPLSFAEETVAPVHVDVTAPYPRAISEFHFFKDPARQIPNDGVVPYDLNTPLFSDYAAKHRFIWLPPGTSAAYHDTEVFDFPVGTAIIKTFSYLHDIRDPAQGERIIETRVLLRKADGWVGLPYIWNENVTDARLAVAGGTTDVEWTHFNGEKRSINYIIPNMNQCKQCHENDKVMKPIGPKARNINKNYEYPGGTANQLAHWVKVGYLSGAPANPADAPAMPAFDDPGAGSVADRARAWLDINCAHCHNPKGPGFTSGLNLYFYEDNPAHFGVNKPPVAAGRGSGGKRFGIVPGDPDASILVHRIESTDPGEMMPTLPRRIVHEEGVALIREWIKSMPPETK